MHRDTLQFVQDKLVNAPAGVESREKNRVAMARIYGTILAECLDRHSMRCMASLIRACAAAAKEKRAGEAAGACNARGSMKKMMMVVVVLRWPCSC